MAKLDTTKEQRSISCPVWVWRKLDKMKDADLAGRSISRIVADWLRQMPEIAAIIAEHENDKASK